MHWDYANKITPMVCAAYVKQIFIPLANNAENEITEIMNCSKSTANSSGLCKRNDTGGVCWWHWTHHYIVETHAMTINTSMLKSYMWRHLVMQTNIPVIYRLTLNKSDLHQTNTILNIYAMTFNLSNKDNYLWNAMITVLSANFAQVSATQTECWCKMNCETHPQTKTYAKQNGLRCYQQCNKPGAIGRNRAWLAQRLRTETNYVKNTTSVSSCNLKQVTLTKYQTKILIRDIIPNIPCQLLHQSRW